MSKKLWKKTYITTLSAKELSIQIKADARSGSSCSWGNVR